MKILRTTKISKRCNKYSQYFKTTPTEATKNSMIQRSNVNVFSKTSDHYIFNTLYNGYITSLTILLDFPRAFPETPSHAPVHRNYAHDGSNIWQGVSLDFRRTRGGDW